MIVPDAKQDARFCSNPYVKTGAVACYAGTPLVTSHGHRIGTLCCADDTPRAWDARECTILANFAEMVTAQLESNVVMSMQRKKQELLLGAAARQRSALGVAKGGRCVLCVEVAGGDEGWEVVHATPDMAELSRLAGGWVAVVPVWFLGG